ncbi:MAG: AAA family ATPase [Acidobacteriota bacterium]
MNSFGNRHIVLISGPPASGKTTLARPIAERLGFALLTKDDIKESLYLAMNGTPGDVEFSRRIGGAAMEVLWSLAPHCPHVVLEANFRTQSPYEREKLATLLAIPNTRMLEVCCRLPREEASRRFAARARNQRHHPAHPLAEMSPDRMMEYEEPFALSPVIEVDTQRPVDLDTLVSQVVLLLHS